MRAKLLACVVLGCLGCATSLLPPGALDGATTLDGSLDAAGDAAGLVAAETTIADIAELLDGDDSGWDSDAQSPVDTADLDAVVATETGAGDAPAIDAAVDVAATATIDVCGDGTCTGGESAPTCVADCAFLTAHLAGSCKKPGTWAGCGDGYICVARSAAGGGNICVADFDTWAPLPEARTASDFTVQPAYTTDGKTGLSWAATPLPAMPWAATLSACTTQTYGGFADWRVPTEAELVSLVDFSKFDSTANLSGLFWPKDPTDMWLSYWSAVPTQVGGHAWGASFQGGGAGHGDAAGSGRVRCVRNAGVAVPPSAAGERFGLVDGGLVILDRAANLRWQVAASPKPMGWSSAKAYCGSDAVGIPGVGWRLPTVRELLTIVDRKNSTPAVPSIFTGTPSDGYWSSSPTPFGDYLTLMLDKSDDGAIGAYSDNALLAQCVR